MKILTGNKLDDSKIFIAYSYVYIDLALKAISECPLAECILLQPHTLANYFSSSKIAINEYKTLFGTDGIPMLITSEGRMTEYGQKFKYGAKLLDIIDRTERKADEKIKENARVGKWIYQSEDSLYSPKNVLLVKTPIKKLSELTLSKLTELPVSESINILKKNYRMPVKAVSIPAPKTINKKYIKLLEDIFKL